MSYYGADDTRGFPEAEFVHRFKGGKWDGLGDFFDRNAALVEQYDYFWLPDDDIMADCATINQLFDLARVDGLELCQPSLAPASYLSHLITLNNPGFIHRQVNFIEIMVPLLSRAMIKSVLPLFGNARSGFGIDFVWHRFTSDPRRKVAVLDAVSVTHTRPVGGNLHAMLSENGVPTARQEQEIFLKPYGKVKKTELVLGGKLLSGRVIANRHFATLAAAAGWIRRPSGQRGFTTQISALRFCIWVIRYALMSFISSTQLEKIAPIIAPTSEPDRCRLLPLNEA